MADLRVSVVVPTHDRPARLDRLLTSLRAQTLAAEEFEVIVVDDGGSPATETVLRHHSSLDGLALRRVRHTVASGPAAARNSGWRAAQAPLVAFTDDDCTASPNWLAVALGVSEARPAAIVQGATRPDPNEHSALGPFSRTVSVDSLGPQYETCNIFYPRAALESLGGFDQRFGERPAAEDTDLAWRAIENGWETTFAPDALVFHAVERIGARGALRVARRWEAAIRVFAEHPQTRSMLYRGVFWNVWHYLLWRSMLSLPGPAWLRRMLLVRHLLALGRRAQAEGAGLWAVPFLVLHDAIECAAVARGALRHRTFVL